MCEEWDDVIVLRLSEHSVNKVIEMLTKEHIENAELRKLRKENRELNDSLAEHKSLNEYGESEWTKEKMETTRLLKNNLRKFLPDKSGHTEIEQLTYFGLVSFAVEVLERLDLHERIDKRCQSIVLALTAIDSKTEFKILTKEDRPTYHGQIRKVSDGIMHVKEGTVTTKVDLRDVTEITALEGGVDEEKKQSKSKD